jgi:NitT/TauT family transport system substrate-binding protein
MGSFKRIALTLSALLLVSACADGDQEAEQATDETPNDDAVEEPEPQELTAVTLRTDFMWNGYISPIALAVSRGYCEEVGLDVSIEEGQGSATTAQTVASAQDDFGIADSGTVVRAITEEDVPISVVSVYLQTIPMGFIHHPGSPVNEVEDLADRTIVSSAGAAEITLLPAILTQADMTEDDVDMRLVDAAARIQTFLEDENSVLLGFATGDLLRAQAQEPDVGYNSYAEFGLLSYGTGLIASNSVIESDPDLVEAMVSCAQRGWESAVEDQDAATEASLEMVDDVDEELLRRGLEVTIEELLHTSRTEGQPIGWTSDEDWEEMLDLLVEHGGLSEALETDAYYTNEFVPE